MKIPGIELCPTDPLKYFSFANVERDAPADSGRVHSLDRLFVNDPIRHNVRQSFRLAVPIMRQDDRQAANEVMDALRRCYRISENHLRMIDYAHTVRLYDEIHKYVLRTEPAADVDEQN